MKKFLWKIMAVLAIVALPFVVASCNSDEDEGPKTYTWVWTLQNTSLGSSATTAERAAALAAEGEVNQLLAASFKVQGFKVDAENQKFTIETEESVSLYDNKVKSAVYAVLANANLADITKPLPSSSKIVVKRGSTTVIENKLK